MSDLITFGVVVCVISLIGLFGYIGWLLKNSEGKRDLADNPIIINLAASKTKNGFCMGVLVKVVKGKNGRILYSYRPTDFSNERKTIPQLEKIIVSKNKSEIFPKGTLSPERSIIIIYGNDTRDYPEGFRDSLFLKGIKIMSEIQDVQNVDVQALREAKERLSQNKIEDAEGITSTESILNNLSALEDIRKIVGGGEETRKKINGEDEK